MKNRQTENWTIEKPVNWETEQAENQRIKNW